MSNTLKRVNSWKYSIPITLSDDIEDVDLMSNESNHIIRQLKRIKKSVKNSNLIDDEKNTIDYSLSDIIDKFEFFIELLNGNIHPDDWDDYDFDGNFADMFNNYLTELYDLGDTRVITTNDTIEKFMLINTTRI